jgi:hypothetical protein
MIITAGLSQCHTLIKAGISLACSANGRKHERFYQAAYPSVEVQPDQISICGSHVNHSALFSSESAPIVRRP